MAFKTTQTSDQDPGAPSDVPVPQASPIVTPPSVRQIGATGGSSSSGSSSGGKSDASSALGAVGTIGGTIVGGPIGGAIGGLLGDVFGGLFAQGGLVQTPNQNMSGGGMFGDKKNGYADGGVTMDSIEPPAKDPVHDAMTIGYLTGAYHQKEFGGDPTKLPDAAAFIKNILDQGPRDSGISSIEPPTKGYGSRRPKGDDGMINRTQERGFADGGSVKYEAEPGQNQPDTSRALDALLKAMSTDNSNTMQGQSQVPDLPMGTTNEQMTNPDNKMNAPQGYAGGGPPMPMMPPPQGQMSDPSAGGGEQPPLQPGQTFQGDGSVKGPGGPQDDVIPAKLSNGEFVFAQPAVQFFGVDKLVKMNEQGKQGFMQAMGAHHGAANGPQGAPGASPIPPPGAPPMGMPSGGSPPPQPPQMSQGGSVMRTKGSGYCGM